MAIDDALYAALVAAHEGLDAEASRALDARLILLLMNEVGDAGRVRHLLAAAREAAGARGGATARTA